MGQFIRRFIYTLFEHEVRRVQYCEKMTIEFVSGLKKGLQALISRYNRSVSVNLNEIYANTHTDS